MPTIGSSPPDMTAGSSPRDEPRSDTTTRCAVHQPNFFPRLSTLAKIYMADVWVVLNDVQFARRDYQHRARLARLDDPNHHQWLTLPVHLPHGRATAINQVRLVEPERSRRQVEALLHQYHGRSPHWPQFRTALDELLDQLTVTNRLHNVAETSSRILLQLLDWPGRIIHSATLAARTGRSHRLADLTAAVGATTYLCGEGGARYLDHAPFRDQRITVIPFKTPPADVSVIWSRARKITALWALMTAGPVVLRHELTNHSQRSNLAPLPPWPPDDPVASGGLNFA